jgi:hypothetical protein
MNGQAVSHYFPEKNQEKRLAHESESEMTGAEGFVRRPERRRAPCIAPEAKVNGKTTGRRARQTVVAAASAASCRCSSGIQFTTKDGKYPHKSHAVHRVHPPVYREHKAHCFAENAARRDSLCIDCALERRYDRESTCNCVT